MKRLFKLALQKPELASTLLLVLLIVFFQILSGAVFLSIDNVRGVMGLLPETALVAVGVTLLMICGEFDLSVGSVFALMPMTMAVLVVAGVPFWLAILLGLALCAFIGFINGWITIKFDIPSFITTLGMMFMARSMTVVVSGGFPPRIKPGQVPSWIFTGFVDDGGLIRASVIWFVAIAVLISLLLAKTNFGNWVRATGGFCLRRLPWAFPAAR